MSVAEYELAVGDVMTVVHTGLQDRARRAVSALFPAPAPPAGPTAVQVQQFNDFGPWNAVKAAQYETAGVTTFALYSAQVRSPLMLSLPALLEAVHTPAADTFTPAADALEEALELSFSDDDGKTKNKGKCPLSLPKGEWRLVARSPLVQKVAELATAQDASGLLATLWAVDLSTQTLGQRVFLRMLSEKFTLSKACRKTHNADVRAVLAAVSAVRKTLGRSVKRAVRLHESPQEPFAPEQLNELWRRMRTLDVTLWTKDLHHFGRNDTVRGYASMDMMQDGEYTAALSDLCRSMTFAWPCIFGVPSLHGESALALRWQNMFYGHRGQGTAVFHEHVVCPVFKRAVKRLVTRLANANMDADDVARAPAPGVGIMPLEMDPDRPQDTQLALMALSVSERVLPMLWYVEETMFATRSPDERAVMLSGIAPALAGGRGRTVSFKAAAAAPPTKKQAELQQGMSEKAINKLVEAAGRATSKKVAAQAREIERLQRTSMFSGQDGNSGDKRGARRSRSRSRSRSASPTRRDTPPPKGERATAAHNGKTARRQDMNLEWTAQHVSLRGVEEDRVQCMSLRLLKKKCTAPVDDDGVCECPGSHDSQHAELLTDAEVCDWLNDFTARHGRLPGSFAEDMCTKYASAILTPGAVGVRAGKSQKRGRGGGGRGRGRGRSTYSDRKSARYRR